MLYIVYYNHIMNIFKVVFLPFFSFVGVFFCFLQFFSYFYEKRPFFDSGAPENQTNQKRAQKGTHHTHLIHFYCYFYNKITHIEYAAIWGKKNYDRISLPSSLKNWPFSSKMCTFSWITRYKRKMSIYFNLYKNSNKNLFWVILRSFFLEYDNLILFLVLFRPWNGYF